VCNVQGPPLFRTFLFVCTVSTRPTFFDWCMIFPDFLPPRALSSQRSNNRFLEGVMCLSMRSWTFSFTPLQNRKILPPTGIPPFPYDNPVTALIPVIFFFTVSPRLLTKVQKIYLPPLLHDIVCRVPIILNLFPFFLITNDCIAPFVLLNPLFDVFFSRWQCIGCVPIASAPLPSQKSHFFSRVKVKVYGQEPLEL